MRCPHCEYKHGFDIDEGCIYGEYGDFYCLSNDVNMITNGRLDKDVYGCPKCNKLFMN